MFYYHRSKMEFKTLLVALMVVGTTANECIDGVARGIRGSNNRLYIEYCFEGEWRINCGGDWDDSEATVACRHLGYSLTNNDNNVGTNCLELPNHGKFFEIDKNCGASETSLSDCKIKRVDTCADCNHQGWMICTSGDCNNGMMRLTGGEHIREGRVEVCVDTKWRTVYNNNQNLPGAICSSLGYDQEGAVERNFMLYGPTLATYSCTLDSNSQTLNTSNCMMANVQRAVLGVECLTQDTVRNLGPRNCNQCDTQISASTTCPTLTEAPTTMINCTRDCPVITSTPDQMNMCTTTLATTQGSTTTAGEDPGTNESTQPGTNTRSESGTTNMNEPTQTTANTVNPQSNTSQCSEGALGALLGVLVAVTIGLTIGWIITCWVLKQQHHKSTKPQAASWSQDSTQIHLQNPTYDANSPPPVQKMNDYSSKGPTYEQVDNNTESTYSSLQHNNRVSMQITATPNQHVTSLADGEDSAGEHVYGELEAQDYEVSSQSKLFETDPRSAGDVENNYHVVSLAGGENSAGEHVYGELEAGDYEVPRQSKLFNTTHNEDYSTLRH